MAEKILLWIGSGKVLEAQKNMSSMTNALQNKIAHKVVIFQPCVKMRMEHTKNAALASKTRVIVAPMLKRGLGCNSTAYKRALHDKIHAVSFPRTRKSSCIDPQVSYFSAWAIGSSIQNIGYYMVAPS